MARAASSSVIGGVPLPGAVARQPGELVHRRDAGELPDQWRDQSMGLVVPLAVECFRGVRQPLQELARTAPRRPRVISDSTVGIEAGRARRDVDEVLRSVARRAAATASARTDPSSIHVSSVRSSILACSTAGSRGARGARRLRTSAARRSASVRGSGRPSVPRPPRGGRDEPALVRFRGRGPSGARGSDRNRRDPADAALVPSGRLSDRLPGRPTGRPLVPPREAEDAPSPAVRPRLPSARSSAFHAGRGRLEGGLRPRTCRLAPSPPGGPERRGGRDGGAGIAACYARKSRRAPVRDQRPS